MKIDEVKGDRITGDLQYAAIDNDQSLCLLACYSFKTFQIFSSPIRVRRMEEAGRGSRLHNPNLLLELGAKRFHRSMETQDVLARFTVSDEQISAYQ